MKFWTIQSEKAIDVFLENGEYYPYFKQRRGNYGLLLEFYNKRNLENLQGVLFGFGNLNNAKIVDVNNLYDYLKNNRSISCAFPFWSDEYCVLEIEVPNDTDVIPIDFNDFIKISNVSDRDIKQALMIENSYTSNENINIINNFNKGIVRPTLSSFTQIHYSHLSIDNIVQVYNNINYKNGELFKLNSSATKLKNIIDGRASL